CTRESWSGEPKRFSRGGGLESAIFPRFQGLEHAGQTLQLHFREARAGPPGVEKLAVLGVVAQQQGAEMRPTSRGVGPADDDEFLAVEAFHLEPQAPIARNVWSVDPLRDDAFDAQATGLLMKVWAIAHHMIAVSQSWDRANNARSRSLRSMSGSAA